MQTERGACPEAPVSKRPMPNFGMCGPGACPDSVITQITPEEPVCANQLQAKSTGYLGACCQRFKKVVATKSYKLLQCAAH